MAMIRRSFPDRIAGIAFSIDSPEGFETLVLPFETPDFDDPTLSVPLAVLSSQVALALVTIAARPAYSDGTVCDWLGYLSAHYNIALSNVTPGEVGGETHRHPAVLAQGTQIQDGTLLQMRLAMLEDGGRLITIHAMCPDELGPSYLPAMQQCIKSFELESPNGSTTPLSHEDSAVTG